MITRYRQLESSGMHWQNSWEKDRFFLQIFSIWEYLKKKIRIFLQIFLWFLMVWNGRYRVATIIPYSTPVSEKNVITWKSKLFNGSEILFFRVMTTFLIHVRQYLRHHKYHTFKNHRQIWRKIRIFSQIFSRWEHFCKNGRIIGPFRKYSHFEKIWREKMSFVSAGGRKLCIAGEVRH